MGTVIGKVDIEIGTKSVKGCLFNSKEFEF